MVISVDTGNKMIKTEHYEFNSGIDVLDTIPGENDEVIEFGGKYYRTTNRRISYMEDKTEDDRYYILTLIAIAKELDTMKKEAVLAPNEVDRDRTSGRITTGTLRKVPKKVSAVFPKRRQSGGI